MNKTKVTLIVLAILAVPTILTFLMVYGLGGREDPQKEKPLPSDAASNVYVLDQKLLATVRDIERIRVGGPIFTMITGTDASGGEAYTWVTGRDSQIDSYGTASLKDGMPKEQIIAKLSELGIPADQLSQLIVAPYDYQSGRIVWFAVEKGIKRHMFWFDFKTGEKIWEAYEDPTAWSIRGNK